MARGGDGCHAGFLKRSRNAPSSSASPSSAGDPLGLSEGEPHISPRECAHFYGNPYDFAIHMVKMAKGIDARWKARNDHDTDQGVRADRDLLFAENRRLIEDLRASKESSFQAEELVARYQADWEAILADRDACKERLEELQGRLGVAYRDLERSRDQLAISQTKLEGAQAERGAAQERLKTMAGKAVDCAYHGYQKGLDHVNFVYDIPEFDADLFHFDHVVKDGRLIRYHANKVDFDVLFP